MTSQAWDFDADLDFDRFGMTGFFKAGALSTTLIMSSSFMGLSEMGLAFGIRHVPLFPTAIDKAILSSIFCGAGSRTRTHISLTRMATKMSLRLPLPPYPHRFYRERA